MGSKFKLIRCAGFAGPEWQVSEAQLYLSFSKENPGITAAVKLLLEKRNNLNVHQQGLAK